MAESLSSQRWHTRVPQGARNRLRRAVLLCIIVTGLVLVGDHSLAGARSHAAAQVSSVTSTAQPSLALFTMVAASGHQSIRSMSERSFEVVTLLVLGLSLLGGGRALTRTRQTRQPVHDVVSPAAGPTEVVSVIRHADAPAFVRVSRSGAR